MKRFIVALVTLMSHVAVAGKLPLMPQKEDKIAPKVEAEVKDGSSLEDLKMRKRFGVGISAGGPLAVLGLEAEVNVDQDVAVTIGMGTGLDFNTFSAKAKWFLLGEWVSPYLSAGVARWWTNGTKAKDVSPAVLRNKFLEPDANLEDGFNVWILHPAVGVQFMHPMGFAVSAELQYFFKLFNLANGTYAGLGFHWYF